MQIVVDALFVRPSLGLIRDAPNTRRRLQVTRSHFMRPACAFNVLFFFFKILTFTRGFDTWGPLVRMIMKVLQEVREFIVPLRPVSPRPRSDPTPHPRISRSSS